MIEYYGKAVYESIAIGPVHLMERHAKHITDEKSGDISAETAKFNSARESAKADLQQLYERTLARAGVSQAEIFSIHMMMVDDLDFEDLVMAKINEGYNAAYAVQSAAEELAAMFAAMDDEYMQGRANDVKDISGRITDHICGSARTIRLEDSAIVVADDVNPSEIVGFEKSKLLGLVTSKGSVSSHMAIIARSMSLPCVVATGVKMDKSYEGKTGIIDGFSGKIIIDPTPAQLQEYTARLNKLIEEEAFRRSLIGRPNTTADGRTMEIYCNIGKSKDVAAALENDAHGIGLMRSEFLYLDSSDYPAEDYQFNEYRQTLEAMGGRTVIIRTMDIGADKKVSYFNLPEEENPAMGLRSLRICLERPEIMKTQLRALYRASVYGKLKIMVPMIISVDEVKWVKKMAFDVRNELKAEGVPFDDKVEIGIMIETPAAAVISDDLADIADFFSIGSNDLTQYTLAIDRQNSRLEDMFDAKHKAVLRLIKTVVENAHKKGKWVGLCGELGKNTELTGFFAAIGLDEVSVSAPYVLKVREKLMQVNTAEVDISKYI